MIQSRRVSKLTYSNIGLASQIQIADLDGELQRPLILVGHSHGADNAIRLAIELDRRGVEVDLLVLLDATTPPAIPESVVNCLHLYRPTVFGSVAPFLFAGNPVKLEAGNDRTRLANITIPAEESGGFHFHGQPFQH